AAKFFLPYTRASARARSTMTKPGGLPGFVRIGGGGLQAPARVTAIAPPLVIHAAGGAHAPSRGTSLVPPVMRAAAGADLGRPLRGCLLLRGLLGGRLPGRGTLARRLGRPLARRGF